MFWLCSCGEKFVESGIKDGYLEIMNHIVQKYDEGQIKNHKIVGFYNENGSPVLTDEALKKITGED